MGLPQNINQKAVELDLKGQPYAWVTVIDVNGSAPRHIGAKMIVTLSESFGTIGGGALEDAAIKDAREQLRLGQSKKLNYPLGPLLGQCCGGEVDIFIEPVMPSKNVVVFGAGHIAEQLIPMLKQLSFNVTLVDERKERIELPAFNIADKKIDEIPSDALKTIEFNADLHIIVITHAHIHDEEIVEYCLDKPFKYLGMIGSCNKWARFKERYRSRGFSEDQFARVSTPIGLDIGAETPFEIAASIIAELIKLGSGQKGLDQHKQGYGRRPCNNARS